LEKHGEKTKRKIITSDQNKEKIKYIKAQEIFR
jgi:hypothetical protein